MLRSETINLRKFRINIQRSRAYKSVPQEGLGKVLIKKKFSVMVLLEYNL